MCTAVHFDNFFGRNLDLEFSYNEQVIITPRSFPFDFRAIEPLNNHYAIIGIGIVRDNYPLYFDAMNEKGLCVAALNFPGNAYYTPMCHSADNIAPFEFIPYILGKCENVCDAEKLLTRINIADIHFSDTYPNSPLHWMIADRKSSIVTEQTKDGLKICRNPVGVLTNNPPFEYHLTNLANYMNITAQEAENRFSRNIAINPYSRGMGGIGLPGDFSSASRFIRSAFVLHNSSECTLWQFFHILAATEQPKGAVIYNNKYEYTVYSSCCDMDKLIYYYTTYENRRITAISMKNNVDEKNLTIQDLICTEDINKEAE